jgi:hypothetical protein
MNQRQTLSIGAGVGIAVLTALAVAGPLPVLAYSLEVAIPFGIASGAFGGAAVFFALDRDQESPHRLLATCVAVFGGLTLLNFGMAVALLGRANTNAMPLAVGVGGLTGYFTWYLSKKQESKQNN